MGWWWWWCGKLTNDPLHPTMIPPSKSLSMDQNPLWPMRASDAIKPMIQSCGWSIGGGGGDGNRINGTNNNNATLFCRWMKYANCVNMSDLLLQIDALTNLWHANYTIVVLQFVCAHSRALWVSELKLCTKPENARQSFGIHHAFRVLK